MTDFLPAAFFLFVFSAVSGSPDTGAWGSKYEASNLVQQMRRSYATKQECFAAIPAAVDEIRKQRSSTTPLREGDIGFACIEGVVR